MGMFEILGFVCKDDEGSSVSACVMRAAGELTKESESSIVESMLLCCYRSNTVRLKESS